MSTLVVDLTGYDSDRAYHGYWQRNPRRIPEWHLWSIEEAKRAVKEFAITRQCDKVDMIELRVPDRVRGFAGDFLKHLLGPAARKLTPPVLLNKLAIHYKSQTYNAVVSLDSMSREVRSYLTHEEYLIVERDKKKAARIPENRVWGDPVGLFVPDIGTKLRVAMPWNFRIHRERRNEHFLKWIHDDPNFKPWRRYRDDTPCDNDWPVAMKPGTIIICDRVYIRQGKGFEDFSSITFRMEKGGAVVYNGTEFTAKRNYRFWAKLRDVNRLLVEVDLNSLPGQEKEGTARK